MNLTYQELLEAQYRYGTTKDDIIKRMGLEQISENVVIAPWWDVNMFDNFGFNITKINDKIYRVFNDKTDFSFIEMKQIGASAIIDMVLSLGLSKCKNLIFIGSVGSLDKNIKMGDLVIPKLSICGDGASKYLNKDLTDDFGKTAEPCKILNEILLGETNKIINNTNVNIYSVNNFSTDSIFAQFPHIDTILKTGAKTIEMETYSLFKSAKIAGIKAAALLCVSDNTISNKSLYSGRTDEDKARRYKVRKEIFPLIITSFFENLDI